LLLKGSEVGVDQSDAVRDNLSVGISGSSAILVVSGGFFALVVSVTSGTLEVFDSLVSVVE
jgi:hypothetical protein